MKTRANRQSLTKILVCGLIIIAVIFSMGIKSVDAKELFDLGDITITWAGVQQFYLPCEVAKAKGFFEDEGIKVGKFFTSKGGSSTVRNIVDGGLPFGECSADSAVMAIMKRQEPFKLIAGGMIGSGSVAWLVRPDSDLKTIQDLKGKTLSFTRAGSVTQALAAMALDAAPGIEPNDVKMIAAGGLGAGLTLLDKGEVDAAMCSYPIMLSKGAKFRVLFVANDYVPDYFQTFWMARESFLKEHPEVVRGFLRARTRGVKYITEHPEETAKILVETNDGIATIADAMKTMKHEGILDGIAYSDNRFIQKGLDNVVKGMKEVGSIGPEVEVPWARLIDQSFIEKSKRIEIK